LAESVKSENFTEKQSKDIASHLDRINNQVLNGKNDVTAEDILSGTEYTITYELGESDEMEKSGCIGERNIDVTYTYFAPTGVTVSLNSCDTDKLITVGCIALGGLVGAIDGPSPFAEWLLGTVVAAECDYIVSELVSANCPYGIIIRASVAYNLEYIICQSPPPNPSCLNYNAWNYHEGTGWIYVYGHPASWVWSDKYQDFIKLYDQTDICDYGIFFETYNPICGRSGRMWDNNVSDNIMWDYSNGGAQFILTCFTGLVAPDDDIKPNQHESSEYSLESMPTPPNSSVPDFTPNSDM